VFSIHEILDMAIRIEKNGETVYRRAIEEIPKPELVSLLTWMADEESSHAEWFSDLKKNIETTSINPFVEEMSRELFDGLLGEKSFSHQEVDFSRIDQIDDLIAVFIEFEKDTILFYEMLTPFIEDESTLENLQKIIGEENNHVAQLQEFIE
jgi:rubrerythrin